jgi:chlorophyll synthase
VADRAGARARRACHGLGAHGIMTLNDFKSVVGDRRCGVRSLPVQLGERRAARTACAVMLAPQLVVVALLLAWAARSRPPRWARWWACSSS